MTPTSWSASLSLPNPDGSPPPGEAAVPRFPLLYVICDVDECVRRGWDPAMFAEACMDGGARLLQLRAKTQQAGAFLALIDTVVRSATHRGASVVVNDRVDLARAAGAAGVHVGQDDLPATVARAQLGTSAIVGVSTHSRDQVLAAVTQPVSYVAVGPVFDTRTKQTGYPAGGLELVADARQTIDPAIPLVAIGGITLARARDVLVAGASAVAVIGDLLTEDPATRVRQYLALLSEARTV